MKICGAGACLSLHRSLQLLQDQPIQSDRGCASGKVRRMTDNPFPNTTPALTLPYLQSNQAQKHVTLNAALSRLDALVQLVAASRSLTDPPASPAEGEVWIAGPEATGAWQGHAGKIAVWRDGGWHFVGARPGWLAFVLDEAALLVWREGSWQPAVTTPDALQQISLLGLGTEADSENPFAAKLNKALWTARFEGEGGDGDLRYTLNKEAPEHTLSLLMQSGWSGRAEIGLTGSDDLSVKVSADGADWQEAIAADRVSGAVRFPQGVTHAPSGAPLSSFLFTPGGDGVVSIWRMNASHVQNPRTSTISSVADDTITLAAADGGQFGVWNGFMAGVAMARIWNISKTPAESAWLVASPNATTLTVLDAASIAGWANGETIQIGDPTSVTPTRVIALDISPMLQELFGTVFRQTGIVAKAHFNGAGSDAITLSGDASVGSFVVAARHGAGDGVSIIPCTELSPVSASNLVFLREDIAGSATLEIISLIAVLV